MKSPLERLKQLPWLILLQAALFTTLIVLGSEYLLLFGAQVPAIAQLLGTLLSPALALITLFGVAMGVGALGVLLLERFNRILIDTGILWGLIACLALVLLIVQAIGLLPLGLAGMSYPQLIGIVLGVFLKGQAYWKSYRRW